MLTPAEKTAIRYAQSRNDRAAGDVRQALGMRNDGRDLLKDLQADLRATQEKVDKLDAAVEVLKAKP